MVLKKAYLRRLISEGKAVEEGTMYDEDSIEYVVVERLDINRTDHYLVEEPEAWSGSLTGVF